MSRRGLTRLEKIALTALAALGVVLVVLFYMIVLDRVYTSRCLSNLHNLSKSLQLYQVDHDHHLPPTYYASFAGEPILEGATGRPITWVSAIWNYLPKADPKIFRCPADPFGGSTILTDPSGTGEGLRLSYGFYAPMGGRNLSGVPIAAQIALIADSVAGGRNGTLDPRPLANGNDGFLLTPDDTLGAPTPRSQFITRLAIWRLDPKQDWNLNNLRAFHGGGVNILFGDGHAATRSPAIIRIERDEKGRPLSPWLVPTPPRQP